MHLMPALIASITFTAAAAAFLLPLRKRAHWGVWIPVSWLLSALILAAIGDASGWGIYPLYLSLYVVQAVIVNRVTAMSVTGTLYCAVWCIMAGEGGYEIWNFFRINCLQEETPLAASVFLQMVWTTGWFLLLWKTIATWMPQKDVYQIGPRQLTSAYLLGLMFLTAFALQTEMELPLHLQLILTMSQVYSATVLCLQTELFKKSQMKKELDMLNFLYEQEAQQYASAKKSIGMIQKKCREMEAYSESLKRCLPEKELADAIQVIETSRDSSRLLVESGNDALDIVLTEKKLLADLQGVEIDCVTDGKLLDFMAPVDIYALFSCALNNAIQAVSRYSDPGEQLLDVLVHQNGNFVVINVTNPLRENQGDPDRQGRKKRLEMQRYNLEMVRHTVEKYHGLLTVETRNRLFALKILLPLSIPPKSDGQREHVPQETAPKPAPAPTTA